MVTLNKPAAGDTDWTTEINDNWTNLETSVNGVLRLIKTADESVTSNASLQDDDELKFSIGANETWQFEFVGFWGAGTMSPDIRVALNGPAGVSNLIAHVQHWSGSGGSPNVGGMITAYEQDVTNDLGTQPDTLFSIRGTVINGSTAGTVVLRWAQRVSNATATTVKKGSYLLAHKI